MMQHCAADQGPWYKRPVLSKACACCSCTQQTTAFAARHQWTVSGLAVLHALSKDCSVALQDTVQQQQ